MPRAVPIISILLLALLVLGVYFLWWPKYQQFEDLRIKVARKTESIKRQEQYFTELEALSKKLENYQTELSKIDSALPLDVDSSLPALLNFVQKTSSENGLIFKGISLERSYPAEPELGEEVQNIVFTILTSGYYSSLKNFLIAIYRNVRLVEIESIRFSYPGPETRQLFNFNLRLRTHALEQ